MNGDGLYVLSSEAVVDVAVAKETHGIRIYDPATDNISSFSIDSNGIVNVIGADGELMERVLKLP